MNYKGLTPKEAALNELIRAYKRSAKERKIVFSLDREQCKTFFKDNCYYCGIEPKQIAYCYWRKKHPYIYNGIDRKNSKLGYTMKNCVTACKECNFAKRRKTFKEFITWLDRVSKYRNHV